MKQTIITLILISSAFSTSTRAQESVLVDIKNITPEEIRVGGFALDRSADVKIEAVGFYAGRRHGLMFTRAWILDAGTREVVWEIEDAEREKTKRSLAEYLDVISLPKGGYEVYYSSYPSYFYDDWDGFGNFIDRIFAKIFDDDEYEDAYNDYREEWDSFKIMVRGNGRRVEAAEIGELRRPFLQNAFVSIIGLRDDENERQAFELKRPMDIRVYAIGEARKDGTFDYGWIINTETREKVWKFNYRYSEHAGGVKKNRLVDEALSLPKGKYVAFFETDDSHSADSWNAAPPNDPGFWGLTLRVDNPAMLKYVSTHDYVETEEKNIIVKITELRDDEVRSEGFKCKRDLNVRIYALGEGKRKHMFDYSWIIDARTRKKIWEMTYRNTEHAGGGSKNRLFDGLIHLDRGAYTVYAVTDGNHSYWDWNTAPPYDKEHWGITLYAVDDDFKPGDVGEYNEDDDTSTLAQVVRMRDYERERERFTLQKDTDVRIYAVGEGMKGHLYDYGWIEDAGTGEVVWEMTYIHTEHAGGAKKNRVCNQTVRLKKGKYLLYFETDDSHSFEEFNDAPPYDPAHWGITVYVAEN
ncbi:MAG: hypothetical protein E2O78_03530 [Caldithrix sp.]|nr:MAG: hypothetical protein E2O78_03530 [Caldithrix sp.]